MLSGGNKRLRYVFKELTGALPVLRLIDVGVSGGIHAVWREWDKALHAIGIDPLQQEIERLRAAEDNPNIFYENAKVIPPQERSTNTADTRSNYPLYRSSAYMGTNLFTKSANGAAIRTAKDYLVEWRKIATDENRQRPTQANYANFDDPRDDPFYRYYQRLFENSISLGNPHVTEAAATLDEIVAKHAFGSPDLLKIDTDGFELDVLRGALQTLSGTLAVEIEVQFHGLAAEGANVFSEIDRFLRQAGFSLMKLMPYAYSRSALPRPFLYPDLPAQTLGGPIQWADALYVRDMVTYVDPSTSSTDRDRRLQIAAMVLDAYGLEDVAAEIILTFPDSFPGVADLLLDALAKAVHGPEASYNAVIEQFLRNTNAYRGS